MNGIVQLSLMAVMGAVLVCFLRPLSPPMALLLSLACGIALLFCMFKPLTEVLSELSGLMTSAGIDGSIYLPVVKAVGISVLVRISAELCRDAGQNSLASKLELAGAVASIAVCLPLIRQVFSLMGMITR